MLIALLSDQEEGRIKPVLNFPVNNKLMKSGYFLYCCGFLLMVQAFLPDVVNGDKRIILINGEPVGAINRVPQEGEARSNMHVGGRAEAVELSPRDREICAAIGPELRKRSLIFVGIDVIGDYLTEINVTSPTGIREMARFTGRNIAANFWDAVDELRPSYLGNGPLRSTPR